MNKQVEVITEQVTLEDVRMVLRDTEFSEIAELLELAGMVKGIIGSGDWIPCYMFKLGEMAAMRRERGCSHE